MQNNGNNIFSDKTVKQIQENFSAEDKQMFSTKNSFIYHSNDLAGALGKLTLNEQKIFDFFTSKIKTYDDGKKTYWCTLNEMLRALDLPQNGSRKQMMISAAKSLFDKSFIIWSPQENGFCYYHLFESGVFCYKPSTEAFRWKFTNAILPYLFVLKRDYYTYPLLVTSQLRNKYAIIGVRLWTAHKRTGVKTTVIDGALDEWRQYFGTPKYEAYRFKDKVLKKMLTELERVFGKHYTFNLKTYYGTRKHVTGYRLTITGDDQLAYPCPDAEKALQDWRRMHSLNSQLH